MASTVLFRILLLVIMIIILINKYFYYGVALTVRVRTCTLLTQMHTRAFKLLQHLNIASSSATLAPALLSNF